LADLGPQEAGMRDATIEVNQVNLYLRAVGDPARPLILFLHGFPEFSGGLE
jgi:pimeloyl-ACP methyl ester carboxylesterase